jgi:propionyl-CoA carboxylase alpha chain
LITEGLGSALDQYVIRGVQHNVPFCRDVLRNDDFVKGYTPTGFIAQHYPDGFSGGQLSAVERKELVAIAGEIARKKCILMGSPPLAFSGKDGEKAHEDEVVVCLGGMFGDAYLVQSKIDLERDCSTTAYVTKLYQEGDRTDESHVVELCNLDYEPSGDLAQVSVGGKDRALQVSRSYLNWCRVLSVF